MNLGHTCPRTDAVLAMHLDGDLDDVADELGFGFAAADALQQHARDCDVCRTALRRARRLDALLAAGAGRGDDGRGDERAARWFAACSARAPAPCQPVAAAGSSRSASWAAAGALAAAAALACTVLVPLAGSPPAPVPTPEAVEEPRSLAVGAPVPIVAQPAGDLHVAVDAARRLQARAPVPHEPIPRPSVTELVARSSDPQLPAADRAAALTTLLAAARRPADGEADAARAAWCAALAACGDHTPGSARAHALVLDRVRADATLVGDLVGRLLQLEAPNTTLDRSHAAAIVVAARVGTESLDRALRRAVRRHPGAADMIAAALRCGARPDGGAALLLDLWHDLAARGIVADDERTAGAWFAGQPAAMYQALARDLDGSRPLAHRLRCLLALGQAGYGAPLPSLLARVASRHHDEAHAAAFALSCLPRDALDPVAAMAEHAFLLRAALARAGHRAATPWVDALALTPREQLTLRTVSFAGWPAVAAWFRDCGGLGD